MGKSAGKCAKCGKALTFLNHPGGGRVCSDCLCPTKKGRLLRAGLLVVSLLILGLELLLLWGARPAFVKIFQDMEVGALPFLTRLVMRNDVVAVLSVFLIGKEFSGRRGLNILLNLLVFGFVVIALFLPLTRVYIGPSPSEGHPPPGYSGE